MKCQVEGCDRPEFSGHLCQRHYERFRKFGNVQAEIPITKSRPGSRNSNWKGGKVDDGHGRVLIYSPNHPKPSYRGTHVYRYRLVMEEKLGRYLLPSEIVHHINGDVSDDRPENLQVMSKNEHAKLHVELGHNPNPKTRKK